jgi:hypothetical protein
VPPGIMPDGFQDVGVPPGIMPDGLRLGVEIPNYPSLQAMRIRKARG